MRCRALPGAPRSAETAPMTAPSSAGGPPTEPATILVIDDEPQIRRALKNALSEVFDRVMEADTGQQGIDLAATVQPDLIILDLGLPDTPGLEVCREIRRWAAMPIIVL